MRAFGRVLLAGVLGGAVCGGVAAQESDADRRIAEPDQILGPETTLTARTDLLARMTVDVMINGQGPFPFAVDTGADRTAISASLAAKLKLPAGDDVSLNGMAGVDQVRTVTIGRLDVGTHHLVNVRAPALKDADLGVAGLLGIDALAGHRIVMDFDSARLTLRASLTKPDTGEMSGEGETITVLAKRRFGQLVLVDASINGKKIYAIVDSGAQITVGNLALRRLMTRQGGSRRGDPIELVSVTGRKLTADLSTMPTIRLGGFEMSNVQVAYSDAHPFKKFGLLKQPALLLGADVLQSFKRVSLDFETKKVRFLLKPNAFMEPRQAVAIALP